MRIDDLKLEPEGEWVTASARVTWEENDRPTQRLRMQFGTSLAEDVDCDPNAFFVAMATPAAFFGERRLAVEGTLCPVLVDGVLTVLTQQREWNDPSRVIPTIEPSRGFAVRTPLPEGRAGQFFSGGIDALATLRRNRQIYPIDHPGSIRDCLYLFGFHPYDIRKGEMSQERFAAWQRNRRQMRNIAASAGVEVHGVITNVNTLVSDDHLYENEHHSALMCAVGHLLTRRLDHMTIASSDYRGDSEPWGSHPLIDPYYSSSNLRFAHDGDRLRRIEKVRLVAEWPEALATLQVCNRNTPSVEGKNCGTCPKCLRTMTELLLCGKLHEATTFPASDVDPDLIRAVHLMRFPETPFWLECLEPLAEIGRHDLVAAISDLVADYHARMRRRHGYGLKPKLKRLDEKLLGGWMRRNWKSRRQRRTGGATAGRNGASPPPGRSDS